jgi:hypothetical protein
MRKVVTILGGYVAVSLLTLVVAVIFRGHASMVNSAVWIRGTIVAASSLLTLRFAVGAAGGDRGMLRRLRIITAVMLAAIVVIIALPGTFPVWMKIEQGICGVLLAAVVVMVNRRSMHRGI